MRLHRGVTVGVVLQERSQGLEGLRLLAAHGDEGRHRRTANARSGDSAPTAKVGAAGGGRDLVLLEDRACAILVEHLQREAVQAFAQAVVGAVVDHDGLDGELGCRDRPPTRDRECSPGVCVWPPSPKLPLLLPSMARLASPPLAVFFCVALPLRATLRPSLRPRPRPASASCSCRAARCGRSGRASPCRRPPASSFGRPLSSGSTLG